MSWAGKSEAVLLTPGGARLPQWLKNAFAKEIESKEFVDILDA
jgi:hypothetical protein